VSLLPSQKACNSLRLGKFVNFGSHPFLRQLEDYFARIKHVEENVLKYLFLLENISNKIFPIRLSFQGVEILLNTYIL
jgi:hypothetical protein